MFWNVSNFDDNQRNHCSSILYVAVFDNGEDACDVSPLNKQKRL